MAKKQKSRSELEVENRLLRTHVAWSHLTPILMEVVRWSGLGVIFWFIYLSVDSLAGKKTAADINLAAVANVSTAMAWICGAVGVGYGLRQKRLAKAIISQQRDRIKRLEDQLNTTVGASENGTEESHRSPVEGTRK